MILIKYRDAGMHTYTYFFVTEQDKVCSPYFDHEEEAYQWLEKKLENISKNSQSELAD